MQMAAIWLWMYGALGAQFWRWLQGNHLGTSMKGLVDLHMKAGKLRFVILHRHC